MLTRDGWQNPSVIFEMCDMFTKITIKVFYASAIGQWVKVFKKCCSIRWQESEKHWGARVSMVDPGYLARISRHAYFMSGHLQPLCWPTQIVIKSVLSPNHESYLIFRNQRHSAVVCFCYLQSEEFLLTSWDRSNLGTIFRDIYLYDRHIRPQLSNAITMQNWEICSHGRWFLSRNTIGDILSWID